MSLSLLQACEMLLPMLLLLSSAAAAVPCRLLPEPPQIIGIALDWKLQALRHPNQSL